MKAGAAPGSASVEMIRTLIGFPTVSRDSNLELIHYLRDYLKPYVTDVRLTHDDDRRKANLFATLGSGQGGVVLSGHTDVVPVEGQPWDHDPFTLVERQGRLFGRGTADDKGQIFIHFKALEAYKENGVPLPINIKMLVEGEEEVGSPSLKEFCRMMILKEGNSTTQGLLSL